ncbi:hypothetical protein HZS_4529 [Henneguya salminicola]|nr:hypothetical protein HZS_4529 [Henneguya salminicola]
MGDSEDEFSTLHNRNKFHSEREEIVFAETHEDDQFASLDDSYDNKKRSSNYPSNRGRRNSPNRRPRYYDRMGGGDRPYQARHFSNNRPGYQQYQRRPREIDYNRIMTFKDFVFLQEDKITPLIAAKKFEEYSLEFSKRQLPLFFDKHKTNEWFLIKYHPYFSCLEKIRTIRFCRRRKNAFFFLKSNQVFDFIALDSQCNLIAPFLNIVNRLLDNMPVSDILEMLQQLKNVKENVTIREESDDLKGVVGSKRKCDQFTDGDKIDPFDTKFKSVQNIFIEIKNVPNNFKRRYLVKGYKNIEGFLRVALLPPESETATVCRAYVVFRAGTDPLSTIQSINETQVKDFTPETVKCFETDPIIRAIRGVWDAKKVVIEQIKIIVEIIKKLDESMCVYSNRFPTIPDYNPRLENESTNESESPKETKSGSESEEHDSFDEGDDIIDNYKDNSLIFEAEKILNQQIAQPTDVDNEATDSQLLSMLDSLVMYLRIVHSYDFYSFSSNSQENDMPGRCQTLSIRKSFPLSSIKPNKIETQIDTILCKTRTLFFDSCAILNSDVFDEISGDLKKEKTEIDNYMEEKAKELRPNVWICHICKKKFQGKDFVHKHILNKHSQNLEFVKINVNFYNNFIIDRKNQERKLPISISQTEHENGEDNIIPIPKKSNISSLSESFNIESTRKKQLPKYSDLDELDLKAFDF